MERFMKIVKIAVLLIIILTDFAFSQDTLTKGKFSGYMFGDYFYNAARDKEISKLSNVANGGEADLNGFQFRRIYFTYDYNISDSFSSRFRLEADQAAKSSNDKISVFVKDAYLQWKNFVKGSDIFVGIQPTPAYEISEGYWGNRFLEKTIMDLRGIVSSRDMGISIKGKFNNAGTFNYWVMYGNSSGNSPEKDKYKRYYAHLQFNPINNFTATLYADLKARPQIVNPFDNSENLDNNIITYAVFIGYKEKNKFSTGAEGFLSTNQNGYVSSTEKKNLSGAGISLFASYFVSPILELAGRYDYFDPNTDDKSEGDSRNLFIFSLNYKLDEKVTISPNIIIESYQSLLNGNSYKNSVTPRITFYYSFL